MNAVVIYYSLEGNTRTVAVKLSKYLSADLLELKPEKEIDSGKRSKYFWGGRQVIMKTKPPLKPYSFDEEKYDLIALGSPVWALSYASPLRTFLSENDINGKEVILFCTHEGAAGHTLKKLKEKLNDNTILSSKDFNRAHNDFSEHVTNWIENISIKKS